MNISSYPILLLSSLAGFFLALYIYKKKRQTKKMVCMLGADCDGVVRSRYAKFFGMPVEVLGMLYYAVIVIGYSIAPFYPALQTPLVTFILLTLSVVAFLFSLYLTFIQTFTLRQLCTWCLASAGLSSIILITSLSLSSFNFIDLLARHKDAIVAGHILGVVLGLGGATITDILFFKFLKDYKISRIESSVMQTLSQIIWFGLAVGILTGLGLYLPRMAELGQSAKFLVKVIVVGVIIVNGAFLNLLITPKLARMHFNAKEKTRKMARMRKLSFALGAISITSWYSAFILGSMHSSPIAFKPLLTLYIGIVFLAILSSQLVERRLMKE